MEMSNEHVSLWNGIEASASLDDCVGRAVIVPEVSEPAGIKPWFDVREPTTPNYKKGLERTGILLDLRVYSGRDPLRPEQTEPGVVVAPHTYRPGILKQSEDLDACFSMFIGFYGVSQGYDLIHCLLFKDLESEAEVFYLVVYVRYYPKKHDGTPTQLCS
jgi:hypothetical protein